MASCVHVFVSGRVQGVGFRAWTAKQAESLGLDGWVRNLTDGRVEAVFAGEDAAVADMLARCQKGPMWGKVTDLDVSVFDGPVAPGFERRSTV